MERGHREPRVGDREWVRHAVDLSKKEENTGRSLPTAEIERWPVA